MKRTTIILFALFLFLSIGQLWAQEQMPYKSAVILKGDTARYLEYNFTKRASRYKGKTVGEVLSELEYPVLYVYGVYRSGLDNCNMETQLAGLYLYIKQIGNKPSELKDYYIVIHFENPPTSEKYKEASGVTLDNTCPALSPRLYDFIKDLKVLYISSNEHILKDPEVLKAKKERILREREKDIEDAKRAGATEEGLKPFRESIERLKKD